MRGMADACLSAIGVETSAAAVAMHYGARSEGGLLDAWLVDDVDEGVVGELQAAGIAARAVPLWMRDEASSAALAAAAIDAGDSDAAALDYKTLEIMVYLGRP